MSQRPLLRKMITTLSMTNIHSFPHDSIRKLRRSIQISVFCEQLLRKAIGQEVRRTLGRDLKDEAARASLETRRGNTFYRTNTRDEDGFYDEDEPPAFHGVFGPDKSMYVQIHSSPRLSVPNYHRGLLTENGLEYGQDDIAEPGDHFEVGWVHTRPGGKASMLDPEWKRHFFAALHKIGAGSIGFVPLNGAGNVQRKILFQRIANDFHKQTSGVTPADNHPRLTREEHYFGMNR